MGTKKRDIQRFIEYFSSRGFSAEWQNRETVDQLKTSWIDTLCAPRNAKRLQSQQFLWHMFSGGDAPHVEGIDASDEYRRMTNGDFHIWTDQHGLGALKLRQADPPDVSILEGAYLEYSFLGDLYVASVDFKWIFAVTHERAAGYGPYFSKSRWRNG